MDTDFNEDYLVRSSAYIETMNGYVLPWLSEREHSVSIQGYGGRPLFCVSYNADVPVGTVVIVHGFTENALKYAELIWSLLHLHFSVIAYDQRGHGRSWRAEGIPDPSVTHVDHFSDYVEDLKIICHTFRSEMPAPFYIFAHSMGGAVASLFLEDHPSFFSAAVLSSPMIAPNIGGIPVWVANGITAFACLIGKEKKQPFFMKTYSGPEDFAVSCATDPQRFAWYDSIKASRKEFRNSVPSYRWSSESIHVTDRILAPGAPEKISCPVLLYTAENDSSVLPVPQKSLIERISDGSLVYVKNARHEIYRSTDDVLFPWWHRTVSFFLINQNIPEGGPCL